MRRRNLLAASVLAPALVAGGATSASAASEEELAIAETAKGLQQIEEDGGLTLEDGTFVEIDFDELAEQLEAAPQGHTRTRGPGAAKAMTVSWDWNSFGTCMAKEVGITDAKLIIKAFAEPKVRKALKSKQWKKASSIFFETFKKVSPKAARFVIKKAASSVLPGGAVGMVAIGVAKCGAQERV